MLQFIEQHFCDARTETKAVRFELEIDEVVRVSGHSDEIATTLSFHAGVDWDVW